jgi:hypothetical protein
MAVDRGNLVLKRRTVSAVRAECGNPETRMIEVKTELSNAERVIDVRPMFANLKNITRSAIALVRYRGPTAFLQYGIEAGCPGSGQADLLVNFIVTSKAR